MLFATNMGCSVDQSLDDLNDFVNFFFCGVRKAVLNGIKRGKIGIVLESTNWVSRSCCFSHQYCERRNISQSNPKKTTHLRTDRSVTTGDAMKSNSRVPILGNGQWHNDQGTFSEAAAPSGRYLQLRMQEKWCL